jgi:hypothetical protein
VMTLSTSFGTQENLRIEYITFDVCKGNLPRVPWATGYDPKTLDMIGSLQWQTAGEPYTPYQEIAPPLQAEEEGPPT